MQSVQLGDRVQVHYVKRFEDGSQTSSRGRAPLELTVGVHQPRLPGLGLALVGLVPGSVATVSVTADHAYGPVNPSRVHRWARTRFPEGQSLRVGKWVPVQDRRGRRRLVRIQEVRDNMVIIDTIPRRAGQALELEVELISIRPRAEIEGQRPAAAE